MSIEELERKWFRESIEHCMHCEDNACKFCWNLSCFLEENNALQERQFDVLQERQFDLRRMLNLTPDHRDS